ncbi:uncharacterized protein EI90DRAFT_3138673 [Cantharellus anzutake]|uniref:uncharacterized protein n=1 Tax=Cantharellus anzutake TaxID=1750568 RepID=UPI0019070A26|nr:uncharacterized protein EI90DRAFT_3138673 [Cantharellus anzutake]KAF8311226.1 hypothetical protein EI90DRAFT_3138673 [Cantharellus anzutake]
MVKKASGSPSAERMRAAACKNAQNMDNAGIPSVNMPDIPPNPGETDDPDASPGPQGDLDMLGPSQFTTMIVSAVIVPPPPEDPPDVSAGPDPFIDMSGSPDSPRLGGVPGPGDGSDQLAKVIDVDGNQPPMETPGLPNNQRHSELMMMLRSIDQWLDRLED